MESKRIMVSNPSGDSMGASLRSLLEVLEQWSQLHKEVEIVIDLNNVRFVHPFFILPLCALCAGEQDRGTKINYELHSNIESYLKIIHFPLGFDALTNENWKLHLLNYASKTYLPACKIPVSDNYTTIREQLLTTFENILLRQLNLQGQIITAVKYLISEAIDNIVDHSGTGNGWIMVQHYPQKGYIDICIADTGTGILGSYQKAGITKITNDSSALKYAINGKSTKQITETRGYGIDTSRRMLVEGLNGKYVLFSGKAIYIYTHELEQITPLQGFGWQGTLLALQVPVKPPVNFDYTTFLE
jgi:hypothetical protein